MWRRIDINNFFCGTLCPEINVLRWIKKILNNYWFLSCNLEIIVVFGKYILLLFEQAYMRRTIIWSHLNSCLVKLWESNLTFTIRQSTSDKVQYFKNESGISIDIISQVSVPTQMHYIFNVIQKYGSQRNSG